MAATPIVPTPEAVSKYHLMKHLLKAAVYFRSSQALFLKLKSATTGLEYVSKFIALTGGIVYAEHDCQAVRTGQVCWHLAAAKEILESVPGAVSVSGIVLAKKENLSAKVYEAALFDPDNPRLIYADGRWISDNAAPALEPVPAPEPEPEPEPEPDEPAHPDDVWLSVLNLPARLHRALIDFRTRQRERLLAMPKFVHLVPNLGMACPEDAPLSSLAFACTSPPKHMLRYVAAREDIAWALAPLLYPGTWEPLLVSGPAGTGKTMMAHYMANLLMLPLAIYCGNAQTNIESMLGEKEIANENGSMVMCHAPGIVLDAIQSGMLLCFNEINHVLPEVSSFLNDILDFQKSTYIHGVGRVDVSPDFRFVATRNKGYYGTCEMNQALLDRCREIDLPYPELVTVEKIILSAAPGVEPETAIRLAKLYGNLIHAALMDNPTIGPENISLRGLIRVAKDTRIFGEDKKIVLRGVTAGVDDEATKEALKQLVDALFSE